MRSRIFGLQSTCQYNIIPAQCTCTFERLTCWNAPYAAARCGFLPPSNRPNPSARFSTVSASPPAPLPSRPPRSQTKDSSNGPELLCPLQCRYGPDLEGIISAADLRRNLDRRVPYPVPYLRPAPILIAVGATFGLDESTIEAQVYVALRRDLPAITVTADVGPFIYVFSLVSG